MSNQPNPADANAGSFHPHPPHPPLPPCPRGPAGPAGPPGPRGEPGSMNSSAFCFSYAQLAHVVKQLVSYYPTTVLYAYLTGLSPTYIAGPPYQLYQSSDGTYGALLVLGDETDNVAIPLSAIAALQFESGTAYNPSITYLPKPTFVPGCDTNEITAIHDFVGALTEDVVLDSGSVVSSIGPLYQNKYGLIVQADALGNDPAFIPTFNITAISQTAAAKAAAQKSEANQPTPRIIVNPVQTDGIRLGE